MLISVNHILQTVDDAPNICPMKIKPQKKVKPVIRKEAVEQDQRDLPNPRAASESDEDELQLTPRQLHQLHSITPQVPKQKQFETSNRPNLKQVAPKEVPELTSELTEEGTNVDFEITEKGTKSSDKIRAPVNSTQNISKNKKSSGKISPTVKKQKTKPTQDIKL